MLLRYPFILVCALQCNACQLFDPTVARYETLMSHGQSLIIEPFSEYSRARKGDGFVVIIKQEQALRTGAPNSLEFKQLLERQLSLERSRRVGYCSNYELHKYINSKHWYTEISYLCISASKN